MLILLTKIIFNSFKSTLKISTMDILYLLDFKSDACGDAILGVFETIEDATNKAHDFMRNDCSSVRASADGSVLYRSYPGGFEKVIWVDAGVDIYGRKSWSLERVAVSEERTCNMLIRISPVKIGQYYPGNVLADNV